MISWFLSVDLVVTWSIKQELHIKIKRNRLIRLCGKRSDRESTSWSKEKWRPRQRSISTGQWATPRGAVERSIGSSACSVTSSRTTLSQGKPTWVCNKGVTSAEATQKIVPWAVLNINSRFPGVRLCRMWHSWSGFWAQTGSDREKTMHCSPSSLLLLPVPEWGKQ